MSRKTSFLDIFTKHLLRFTCFSFFQINYIKKHLEKLAQEKMSIKLVFLGVFKNYTDQKVQTSRKTSFSRFIFLILIFIKKSYYLRNCRVLKIYIFLRKLTLVFWMFMFTMIHLCQFF